MTETNIQVLQKIREGKSYIQIMSELKMSYVALLKNIRDLVLLDYNFEKTLFCDGTTILKETKKVLENINQININFKEEKEFRCLFISDLHAGSEKDRLELVDKVSNYAINNRINFIFNLGDVVENTYTNAKLRLETIEEQIQELVEKYPCDRRLVHIIEYGNHDYYSLQTHDFDIAKEIEKQRPDMISLGYGRGYVGLANDHICLEHECNDRPPERKTKSKISFIGHSHLYKTCGKEIYVPALSDEVPSNYSMPPLKGFLDVNFILNRQGLISKLKIQHFAIEFSLALASKSTIMVRKRAGKE